MRRKLPVGSLGLSREISARGPLGLIAGAGGLPAALARAAKRRGLEVVAAGFPGLTDPALEEHVDVLSGYALGAVAELLEQWRSSGVRDAVMAGKVPKTLLVRDAARLGLDALARDVVTALPDRRDDSILCAIANVLEREGIALRPQAELVPELLAGPGPLGCVEATAAQWADIAFGWPIAKAVSGLDIGQSVVVLRGAVLAIEAIEGTDAAIRRAAALAGGGVCVLKVSKPDQDPRFDLPAIGLGTLEVLIETRAGVLAFEADRTLLLDRSAVVAAADAHGIALVGVSSAGPSSGGPEALR